MPIRDGYPEGVPCWVELGTPDVDAAAAFYGAVFDWDYVTGGADGDRLTALARGLPAAGIRPVHPSDRAPSWTSYFAVDDADVTADRIAGAGGTLLIGPEDVTTAGRTAVATDTTGAVFGIWQAGDHFGAALVNEHGGLNWNELITDDTDRATAFYVDVLGFDTEIEEWGEGRFYTTFKVRDRAIAGAGTSPGPEIPNHWAVYLAVGDAAAAVDAAASHDGSVLREAIENPGVGTIARLADPFGASFNIIELDLEID